MTEKPAKSAKMTAKQELAQLKAANAERSRKLREERKNAGWKTIPVPPELAQLLSGYKPTELAVFADHFIALEQENQQLKAELEALRKPRQRNKKPESQ